MFEPGHLFATLVVSVVGFGLFTFGRKQRRYPQLLVGIGMLVFPYFVANTIAIWVAGAALVMGLWDWLRFVRVV